MSHHYVHVVVAKAMVDEIIEVGEREGVIFSGLSAVKGPNRRVSFLTTPRTEQALLDDLQQALARADDWQITLSPVDAVVTKSRDAANEEETTETREELLASVARDANLTPTYITLVTISAIVAALGMIEINPAAIIGAMVIAPLLGPILASILGMTLGESALIARAARAGMTGIAISVATGAILGLALDFDVATGELAARAAVGFDDVALALAAGTAAALSMTAGAVSILVGVMVAVALMPPAVAIGLFLGKAAWAMAGDACLLLAINLAALHLSGQIVFLVRGVRPRTRYRRARIRQSIRLSLIVIGGLLVALTLLIAYKVGALAPVGLARPPA